MELRRREHCYELLGKVRARSRLWSKNGALGSTLTRSDTLPMPGLLADATISVFAQATERLGRSNDEAGGGLCGHPSVLAPEEARGQAGDQGVNWLTVLGEAFVTELGGADRVEVDVLAPDSRFIVRRFEGGLLIQAGPRPQLGDAKRDLWPELYVKLSKYLKPIRITEHRPFQMGGPGERFTKDRSEAWLRRFDDR